MNVVRGRRQAREGESSPHALSHILDVACVPLPDVLIEAGGEEEHVPGRNREWQGEKGEGFVRGDGEA